MKSPWKPFPPAGADERLTRYFDEARAGRRLPRHQLHMTRTRKGTFYHLTETVYRPILARGKYNPRLLVGRAVNFKGEPAR